MWTPALLNEERRNGSLENLQGPYRESNPEFPFLWSCVVSSGTFSFGKCLSVSCDTGHLKFWFSIPVEPLGSPEEALVVNSVPNRFH